MNTSLEPLEHAPDNFQLSREMEEGADDMSAFFESVRGLVKADLRALDFSDTAVSELADIYIAGDMQ